MRYKGLGRSERNQIRKMMVMMMMRRRMIEKSELTSALNSLLSRSSQSGTWWN